MVSLPVFNFLHVRIAGLYFLVKQKCQRGILGLVEPGIGRERTLGGVTTFVLSLSIPGPRACRIYDAIT